MSYTVLCTANLAAAERWYAKLLGRGPDNRPMKTLVQWNLSAQHGVGLSSDELICGTGSAMFLIVDDLVAERRRLQTLGITLGEDIPGDYSTLAQVRDPDGNLLTLATPPSPPYPLHDSQSATLLLRISKSTSPRPGNALIYVDPGTRPRLQVSTPASCSCRSSCDQAPAMSLPGPVSGEHTLPACGNVRFATRTALVRLLSFSGVAPEWSERIYQPHEIGQDVDELIRTVSATHPDLAYSADMTALQAKARNIVAGLSEPMNVRAAYNLSEPGAVQLAGDETERWTDLEEMQRDVPALERALTRGVSAVAAAIVDALRTAGPADRKD